MPRFPRSLVLAALCLASTLCAQSFKPKTIQFKGADGYSDQDLLAVCGFQPGMTLTGPDINTRVQKLMDSGLFESFSYKFDGVDLIFQIKPAQLFPLRLENLPLMQGPDLDAQIRKRVPLYRGKVPSEGTALNDVQAALTDLLKTKGIDATLTVTPFGSLGQQSVSAMNFTITSPQVLIGEIQPDSGPLDPDAQAMLAHLTGAAYSRGASAGAIEHDIAEAYRDKGYLEANVTAAQQDTLAIAADAVRIPFHVSVTAGPLYKVAAIQLAPDMLVTQADFDKQAHTKPGDVANAEHIRENWHYIERQYHNRGYMKAQVKPVPTLDHAQGTVTYAVSAVPGPVYSMGKLTVENVSDDLRALILKAWKMPEGAVFNEGAILSLFATHDVNPQLERVFANVKVNYTLHLNDDTHTVDTVIRLQRR